MIEENIDSLKPQIEKLDLKDGDIIAFFIDVADTTAIEKFYKKISNTERALKKLLHEKGLGNCEIIWVDKRTNIKILHKEE